MPYKQNIYKYIQPSTQPPLNPIPGDMWWQPDGGKSCKFLNSNRWVCTLELKGNEGFILWPDSPYYPIARAIEYFNFPFAGGTNTGLAGVGAWPNYGPAGCHNGTLFGYIAVGGGTYGSMFIEKFPFSYKGASVTSNATATGTYAPNQSACNNSINGYFTGGNSAAGTPVSTIVRNNFALDTLAMYNGVLTGSRSYTPAMHNCSSFGFSAGGTGSGSGVAAYSFIDRFSFALEGNSVKTANMTVGRSYIVGFNSSVAGYTCGGWNATLAYSSIEKFNFPDATSSAVISNLTTSTYNQANGVNSKNEGYTLGGGTAGSVYYSFVQRVTFAQDTAVAAVVGNLSASVSLVIQGIDTTDFINMFV
jgi:hypothetical protein